MSASHPLEPAILKVFAEAKGHSLSATALKAKLTGAKSPLKGADPAEFDRALAALIDAGKLSVINAKKDGQHPRTRGSYRLIGAGKDHAKPQKPDIEETQLASQEAYLLIQFFRIKDNAESMSRADLNGKLKTKAAKEKLELDPTDNKQAINYHLHNLVAAGSLDEQRKGVSTVYKLTAEGRKALGAAQQYDDIPFTLTGSALNALLAAARESAGKHHTKPTHHAEDHHAPEPAQHESAHQATDIEPTQIHAFVKQLKADKYAGKDLIPIHEVWSLVARHHGAGAADHAVFDEVLMAMRADEELKLIAIADSRDTPREHLDASIEGMNETLFFIDTKSK